MLNTPNNENLCLGRLLVVYVCMQVRSVCDLYVVFKN